MVKMTLQDKINNEIKNHIQFINSFKQIRCGFSVEMERKGKRYTCSARDIMIKIDMNKRTNKIIRLVQENTGE